MAITPGTTTTENFIELTDDINDVDPFKVFGLNNADAITLVSAISDSNPTAYVTRTAVTQTGGTAYGSNERRASCEISKTGQPKKTVRYSNPKHTDITTFGGKKIIAPGTGAYTALAGYFLNTWADSAGVTGWTLLSVTIDS